MKQTHRPDLFSWSRYHEPQDIDFNSLALQRPGGQVLIDPLPMSEHDLGHLKWLGPVSWIIVTNSDHLRAAPDLAKALGARVAGPAAEKATFPYPCDRWLADGEEAAPGLLVRELNGSKTPGELALVLEETTLITGDVVRSHQPTSLMWLPPPKLKDPLAAVASVKRLVSLHPEIRAVLVGDGFCFYENVGPHLGRLLDA